MRHGTGAPRDWESPAELPDRALGAEVALRARCADGTLHPDAWFPVSINSEAARREAAGAIAICTACPVRSACLELALRHWTIGQHGIWGGLVPAERGALRLQRLASAPDVAHSSKGPHGRPTRSDDPGILSCAPRDKESVQSCHVVPPAGKSVRATDD
jgi:hypothetical protein